MPQVNSLTIKDGATPQVDHVFTIQDRDGGRTVFRDSSAATIQGAALLTHTAQLGKSKTAANRNIVTMKAPTEITKDGVVQVSNISTFRTEMNFAPDLDATQRTVKLKLYLNGLNHPDVIANLIAVSPLS